MPIVIATSKPVFTHNVKTQMDEGKPMKQALAIAYSAKRQAMKKRRMAEGGMTEDMEALIPHPDDNLEDMPRAPSEMYTRAAAKFSSAEDEDRAKENAYQTHQGGYAEGGMLPSVHQDKFLTAEMDPNMANSDIDLEHYPDPDATEEGMKIDPIEKRKGTLHKVLHKVRMKHMGRR